MSVYELGQVGDLPKDNLINKVYGVSQLVKNKLPVPEGIYLDHEEFDHFITYRRISDKGYDGILKLVAKTIENGWLPFFSIRCESKYFSESNQRPPNSLLNVGIRFFDPQDYPKYHYDYQNVAEFHTILLNSFNERTLSLKDSGLPDQSREAPAEEIMIWLQRMYVDLENCLAHSKDFICGILIQRMVFGCLDNRSGNGICCNFPGPVDKNTRFRGIFLPYQQGVGIAHGCWGPGEMELAQLIHINPRVYFELRGLFDFLENLYGENRYLEFTVEGSRLYILEHLTRQRLVKAGA